MLSDLGQDPYFDIAVRPSTAPGASQVRLVLRGELDLAGEAKCTAAFELALRERAAEVVVDLTELTFCDSFGFRALLRAVNRCETEDVSVFLVRPSQIVARVLRLSGLDEVFDVVPRDFGPAA